MTLGTDKWYSLTKYNPTAKGTFYSQKGSASQKVLFRNRWRGGK